MAGPDDLFADLIPGGNKPAGAVYGAPPTPKDPKDPQTTWRTLTEGEAAAMGLAPAKVWQVSSLGETKAIGDASPADLITDNDKQAIRAEALQKIQLGASLLKRSKEGYFTTGFGAKTLAAVSGSSPAGGVQADTETLKNAGALQRVIDLNKKTGKNPLTPLSNSDFQALASSIANLDIGQPDEQYQRNVNTVIDIWKRAYLGAGGTPQEVDKMLAEAGIGAPSNAPRGGVTAKPNNRGGGAPPPGGGDGGDGGTPGAISSGELTPDQQKAYEAFWKATPDPTPEQLTTFLSGIGINNVGNAAEIIKAAKEGRGFSSGVIKTDRQSEIDQRIKQEDSLGVGVDPATTLVTQGATLNLSDEAAGIGNALSNAIVAPFSSRVNFDPVGSYSFGRDVERQRIANARQQLGYGGSALEFAGGLASAAPSSALAAVTPRALGAAGAVGGALSGFGAGEGAGESGQGLVGGGVVGGLVGRYAEPVISALGSRVIPRSLRPPQGMAPDVAAAARAENVDLIRPMVDPNARPEFAALESDRFAQPIIRNAVENTRSQLASAAERLGQGGTPLPEDAAGDVLQGAGRRFIQRSRNVADRLYNRARTLAGDTRFEPTSAIAQVDAEIAQLQSNPETNAGEINFLEGLRRDLSTPGGKSVEELRQLRTSLRGRISENNLTATQAEARAIRAMDATQQDVAASVPQAATAYRQADAYYRERMVHIDDIIKRITGGRVGSSEYVLSGEQALKRIKSMASKEGDGRRLAALMRDLTPNERQDIAATLASQIGRRAPDEPFSAALFLSQTRQLSPSARRTIFGPDGAQSIQNLRTLSRALVNAGQDINQSRSGTLLERVGWRRAAYGLIGTLSGLGTAGGAATAGGLGALGGGAGGMAAGIAVAGATMAARGVASRLSARAMVNPRVSMWLADTARVATRGQAQQQLRRLGVIISREPALANELRPIYDLIDQRLTMPLAAQPEGQQDDQ